MSLIYHHTGCVSRELEAKADIIMAAAFRDGLVDIDMRGASFCALRQDLAEHSSTWQIKDPQEAMEVLIARGVLPVDAIDSRVRVFEPTHKQCDGVGCFSRPGPTPRVGCEGRGAVNPLKTGANPFEIKPTWSDHPPSIQSLIAFASIGWSNVLRAESIAHEVAVRLAVCNSDPPQPVRRVAWRMVDGTRWRPPQTTGSEWTRPRQLSPGKRMTVKTSGIQRRTGEACIADYLSHQEWRSENGPDPFAPAVALWTAGLALEAITEREIVIVLPLVPRPESGMSPPRLSPQTADMLQYMSTRGAASLDEYMATNGLDS